MAIGSMGVELKREIWARDLRVISIWVTEAWVWIRLPGRIDLVRREVCLGKNPDGHQQ